MIAKKDNDILKIEVKTSENTKGGIPDCCDTEFDIHKKLVADILVIVRVTPELTLKKIELIDKADVDSFSASHKIINRIRTTKLDAAIRNKKVGRHVEIDELRYLGITLTRAVNL